MFKIDQVVAEGTGMGQPIFRCQSFQTVASGFQWQSHIVNLLAINRQQSPVEDSPLFLLKNYHDAVCFRKTTDHKEGNHRSADVMR